VYQIDARELEVKAHVCQVLPRRSPSAPGRGEDGPRGRQIGLLRLLDLTIALAALIFFAPLMVVVALAVWIQDGGPILFSHRRVGLYGRHFKVHKFRSMAPDADRRLEGLLRSDPCARQEWEADHKLRCDVRITPLGRFLRKSSLDELPQLFNVLRGEMSLVGPRPITDAEINRYGRWFRHYRMVPPGMTGMWQVCGRNDVDYRRRVALDVLYVRRRSLSSNLSILLKTVPAILMRSGSY
jgi:lipopolysaccharide/colanic/teichoic acid biosynthesis glycosyltransferase